VKFLFDFLILILPILSALTWAQNYIFCILICLVVSSTTLILFFIFEHFFYSCRPTLKFYFNYLNLKYILAGDFKDEFCISTSIRPFSVSYFKAYAHITTSIAILAVDYPCFPRRYAKTETFGYSLMDTGVGVFAFILGLTCAEFRQPTIVLQILALKLTNYQQHVTEYGTHWNFFLTLGCLKISIIVLTLPRGDTLYAKKIAWILSLFLISTYEYLLHCRNWSDWILSENRDLSQILDSNREGIVSLLGYIPITLAGCQISQLLYSFRQTFTQYAIVLAKLFALIVICYCILSILDHFSLKPSRRLANVMYYFWIIFFCCSHLFLFSLVELVTRIFELFNLPLAYSEHKVDFRANFKHLEPCILQRISHNGIFYFLTANLLTGLVNYKFRTIFIDECSICFVHLFIYSLFLCFSVYFFRK
uniref:Phosphatidylinositol-glycan biosynthesis class W protein n=1 Tax=Romanomermis culicivorax TaxID=13658 RepID=A0A915I1S9_ROMCU